MRREEERKRGGEAQEEKEDKLSKKGETGVALLLHPPWQSTGHGREIQEAGDLHSDRCVIHMRVRFRQTDRQKSSASGC